MIVRPDFLEHWKTRRLIEITGDESALLALLRLWLHCQNSHRSVFPDMTREQLASICHWGNRKPACHVALVKAGFVDKLNPKGFAAHDWAEHNAQLLQKWACGQKGGRPPQSENNGKHGESEKPTGNRPVTVRVLDRSDRSDRSDPIDQTDGSDPTVQKDGSESATKNGDPISNAGAGTEEGKVQVEDCDLAVQELAKGIGTNSRPQNFTPPNLHQVIAYLTLQWNGAAKYAEPFFKTMQKQDWHHKDGKAIGNWQEAAKAYAKTCHQNQ